MAITDIGDPRLQKLFGDPAAVGNVKPIVRVGRGGPPGWAIAAVAMISAIVLFWFLESRREVRQVPEIRERGRGSAITFSQPPPLYIPPQPAPAPAPEATAPDLRDPVREPTREPRVFVAPPPPLRYEQPFREPTALPQQARTSPGPALVIDTTAPGIATRQGPGAVTTVSETQWGGRARASTLANRTNTVAQGALIPAVLETGFDSTGAGLARAIVSRDVRGFDGENVLIPRGSKLVGEYRADAAPGQKRALITWTRLLRPDGVTVDLDSPAADILGRGGVRARVNTHFWERFGNAVLRTTVDLAGGLATRAATGSVVLAVPGSDRSQRSEQSNGFIPTLSVKPGTSISVFVARDLEFPDPDNAG